MCALSLPLPFSLPPLSLCVSVSLPAGVNVPAGVDVCVCACVRVTVVLAYVRANAVSFSFSVVLSCWPLFSFCSFLFGSRLHKGEEPTAKRLLHFPALSRRLLALTECRPASSDRFIAR